MISLKQMWYPISMDKEGNSEMLTHLVNKEAFRQTAIEDIEELEINKCENCKFIDDCTSAQESCGVCPKIFIKQYIMEKFNITKEDLK